MRCPEQPWTERALDPQLRHGRQDLLHLSRRGRIPDSKTRRAGWISGQQDLSGDERHRSGNGRVALSPGGRHEAWSAQSRSATVVIYSYQAVCYTVLIESI